MMPQNLYGIALSCLVTLSLNPSMASKWDQSDKQVFESNIKFTVQSCVPSDMGFYHLDFRVDSKVISMPIVELCEDKSFLICLSKDSLNSHASDLKEQSIDISLRRPSRPDLFSIFSAPKLDALKELDGKLFQIVFEADGKTFKRWTLDD